MTTGEAVSLAAGVLAVAAAACWPRMPNRFSYILAGAGMCLVVYGATAALQHATQMNLQSGAFTLIIALAILIAGGVLWHIQRSQETRADPSDLRVATGVSKAAAERPTLLTLFMTDSAPDASEGNISVEANGYVDLTLADDSKLRIFYAVLNDHTKRFINFYVPYSSHTYEACEFCATGYRKVLDQPQSGPAAASAGKGTAPVFAGRLFIYHETDLTRQELRKLSDLYAANQLQPEFRGARYAAARARRQGEPQAPAEFVIKDGLIMRASG
jgi:hypothetical protein